MRLIQNSNVAFRCPDTLKEKLEIFAGEADVHVSVIIRAACVFYLKEMAPHLFPQLIKSESARTNGGWLIER
jgi:hypothetical protein